MAVVTLAIVGSRDLGEPYFQQDVFGFEGYALFPTYRNVAQFNYAIKRLNKAVLKITERERKRNPDFNPKTDIEVITGDALGADHIGQIWAKINQLNFTVKCAKWKVFGKSAGHRRNPSIVKPADYVIALWDGTSKGTLGSIDYAKKHNKKLMTVKYLKHAPNLKKRKVST